MKDELYTCEVYHALTGITVTFDRLLSFDERQLLDEALYTMSPSTIRSVTDSLGGEYLGVTERPPLRAERDRLREALFWIETRATDPDDHQALRQIAAKARALLDEKGGEDDGT